MRHGKKFPHLGRKKGHRNYMLANMACSLIEHKSINTTLTKAKALKMYIEPIITKSKNDSTHNRRIAFRYCLLYTSPSPRDMRRSRMPSSA